MLKEARPLQNPDKDKKQILLRISPTLWEELTVWANDDFRSLNGQIEYLLSECVKSRKRRRKSAPEEPPAAK